MNYFRALLFPLFAMALLTTGCSKQPEPIDPETVIARVYGKEIKASEIEDLDGIIFTELTDRFAAENKIAPTEEEFAAFRKASDQRRKADREEWEEKIKTLSATLADPSLTEADRQTAQSEYEMYDQFLSVEKEMEEYGKNDPEGLKTADQEIATHIILSWKINKALWEKFGGRVVFQQFGPEPLDAYRTFLSEREKNKDFEILDEANRASFWNYFTNDSMHSFYDQKDGEHFVTTPWWMEEEPVVEAEGI